MFAGYETFVSKIDVAAEHEDRPDWMGRVDYSGLKIKVIGSLVAISSIELLRAFIEIGVSKGAVTIEQLKWKIAIHLVFLLSGVMFALMDFISVKREAAERQLPPRNN